ncbi:MAG: universal stress protein [Deltaproteobacteria bacterium]|nr:universal stress protein [Deltaproteobacteria bacterium]
MELPKLILVPTDFGGSSDRALAYAASLGKALGAELVLLHAYELPIVGFPDGALVASPELATRITEAAQIGLKKALDAHAGAGVPMRSLLRQGTTWRTILDVSKELGCDMIVMGTHGRHGLPRALLGSVAEKIVRSSHVPVLTVHAGDGADSPPAPPEPR